MTAHPVDQPETTAQKAARILLGFFMAFAGISHMTFARSEFQAQVPDWVPVSPDVTVLASGAVEIALGASMILVTKRRAVVGLALAAFFVAIFPGNIAQWLGHRDAFVLVLVLERALEAGAAGAGEDEDQDQQQGRTQEGGKRKAAKGHAGCCGSG